MIDRLQDALPHLEHLPPEAQEEAATYIEALVEVLGKGFPDAPKRLVALRTLLKKVCPYPLTYSSLGRYAEIW